MTQLAAFVGLKQEFIEKGRPNRPGSKIKVTSITVHNTDNTDKGADANAHSNFVRNTGYYVYKGKKKYVSWHFTIDDRVCIQHLPLGEMAFHSNREANESSIAVEICMHQGIDQDVANVRAAVLIAGLLFDLGLKPNNVRTHNSWTGKECPRKLLDKGAEGEKWREFMEMIEKVHAAFDSTRSAVLFDKERLVAEESLVKQAALPIAADDVEHPSLEIPAETASMEEAGTLRTFESRPPSERQTEGREGPSPLSPIARAHVTGFDYTLFDEKAPRVMARLIQEFSLTDLQAASILGNLGHECAGFTKLQEQNPREGRGGYGWAQWTASRREDFEKYCEQKELSPQSDEANYGFLVRELKTSEKKAIAALKKESKLLDAVIVFEREYERAGVRNYNSRLRWAYRALAAHNNLMFEISGAMT